MDNKAEKFNAIEQGLLKNPDADTKGILEINKAILLDQNGKKGRSQKPFRTSYFSSDATTANIELAKFTLNSITEKK
jgi:hypothetical protein